MSDAPSNHPSAAELCALSLGRLTEADLARLSAHLRECPECCRRIDQLTPDDPLLSRLQSAAHQEEVLVPPAQRRPAVRALREGQDSNAAARERDQETKPTTLPAPKQVGEYEILAEVGRGGMGVVYRARHRGLRRLAALKMVLAGEFASPGQAIRFRLEAELAARVQHPNIVQVYEVGSHEGRPFLAMEWVDGGSLADRLDGTPWPAHPAARLIETLARAVHEAHEHGVVHRDLKPANILLAVTSDEWRVTSGDRKDTAELPSLITGHSSLITPKIADFGLAQPTEGGQTLTRSGFLVGTPGYMAPEQAGGKRALVGPATDIYGLGVVLYELITGQLPFQGDSTLEVLRAVTDDEAVRPRRLRPGIPRDLEAITLRCLEKEPSRRYPSALALAEDLQRFLEGRPITARPVGAAARLFRWCRRKPWIATLLLLLAGSVAGGFLGVTSKWLEAAELRQRAEDTARQANEEKHAALSQAYRARLSAAAAALQNHDVADAGRQLEDAPKELRDWEWRHLHSRLDDRSGRIVATPGAALFLLPRPDGIQIAQLTPKTGLKLTDLDGRHPRTIAFNPKVKWIWDFQQTSDGLRFMEWVGDDTLLVWDEAGKIRLSLSGLQAGGHVRPSPDGSRLAVSLFHLGRPSIALYQTDSGRRTAICEAHSTNIWALTFSPDGTRIASGSEDGLVCVWDAATGAKIADCRGHTGNIISAAFRHDGARLVTASDDGTVRQWDATTGSQAEPPYDRHSGEALSAVYSPDGKWIASGGGDRTVRVWRATGREEVAVLHGHRGAVYGVAFTPDGRRVVSYSQKRGFGWAGDDTVGVWDIDVGTSLPVLRGHTSYVYPVAYSPDGRRIASGSWDKKVRLWDARTGESLAELDNGDFVKTLAFSPDGSELVTVRKEGLQFWDIATGRHLRMIASPPEVQAVALHPKGAAVAALDRFEGGIIFNTATGKEVARIRLGAAHDTNVLAYSPDGRWLAGASADQKTVCLFDARTYKLSAQFSGHEDTIRFVTFSADSRRLASCASDRDIRVWQVGSGECQVLRGHTDEVFAVAFHPDGKRLATGGRDRAVWLWDLTTGQEVVRLQGHTSYIWSLAFSPDGKTLVSGSGDGTVRLWDTEPLARRRQARREDKAPRAPAQAGEQVRP
jgi:WD40 repeat protein/serine/threonine protein kinase